MSCQDQRSARRTARSVLVQVATEVEPALGFVPDVSFAGPVSGEAKEQLLMASELFLLPSQSESFGTWGHANDLRRYKCKACRRTFNALTGTPLENTTTDLWSLSDFAVPGYLGSRSEFAVTLESERDPETDRKVGARQHSTNRSGVEYFAFPEEERVGEPRRNLIDVMSDQNHGRRVRPRWAPRAAHAGWRLPAAPLRPCPWARSTGPRGR